MQKKSRIIFNLKNLFEIFRGKRFNFVFTQNWGFLSFLRRVDLDGFGCATAGHEFINFT